MLKIISYVYITQTHMTIHNVRFLPGKLNFARMEEGVYLTSEGYTNTITKDCVPVMYNGSTDEMLLLPNPISARHSTIEEKMEELRGDKQVTIIYTPKVKECDGEYTPIDNDCDYGLETAKWFHSSFSGKDWISYPRLNLRFKDVVKYVPRQECLSS